MRRYSVGLNAWLRHKGAGRGAVLDVDDLAQETWIAFFAQLERRWAGSLWRLLRTIATARVKMALRGAMSRGRDARRTTNFAAGEEPPGAQHPDRARLRAQIAEALEALSPAERRCVALRAQGLTEVPIAAIEGVSRHRIRKRLARIRETFAAHV